MTRLSTIEAMELNRELTKPYKVIAILFFIMYLVTSGVFAWFIYNVYSTEEGFTAELSADEAAKLFHNVAKE